MKIEVGAEKGVKIEPGMIGLFFEDINYAADGGLYAEMIENRSFEFVEAFGERGDYYTRYDGEYAWSPYGRNVELKTVMGSALTRENPHYMRMTTAEADCGLKNKSYDGICLKKGMKYRVIFWARCVRYEGSFRVFVSKDGVKYAEGSISSKEGIRETPNFYKKYELTLEAKEDIRGAGFVLCLEEPGTVEFDYISMFPADAVAGIFRKDLFEKLKELHPGFIRFPGGCIVEGNTLDNRYRYKDGLKENWARKNNWNRWAVHGNSAENGYHSVYSHYNQTYGLGFYEYFLLCELIGAKPLPVMNVGFACQYQSEEIVPVEDPQFQEFIQDALDLIEFANGSEDTKWGAVRASMGHKEPFGLTMMGIGNEQWQTKRADFFERYTLFEKAIHKAAPGMKLIGSAGPDITSERYEMAWKFYQDNADKKDFVYAVDEHYYVKPQWLLDHVDFYDEYPRQIKVFSGEYAAHPFSGMNMPKANNLEGAVAEAAFLTGVERNADVVVLASYAPLFARLGYAQWSPDMIWFDGSSSYGTPSYYVQKMYAGNMGTVTLETKGKEKEAAKEKLYYSLSYDEEKKQIIVKAANAGTGAQSVKIELSEKWEEILSQKAEGMQAKTGKVLLLTGPGPEAVNSIEQPETIVPVESSFSLDQEVILPHQSFAVFTI